MIKLKEKLSSEIRNKRQELKMSQEELAEKVNKTIGFIGQLERGESLPSLDTLQDLVNCLGIDLNEYIVYGGFRCILQYVMTTQKI